MLQLIAFTDRNPADRKAKGSIALHCIALPDQGRPKHRKIALHIDLNQEKPAAQTHSIYTQITISIWFSDALPRPLCILFIWANTNLPSLPTSERPTHRLSFVFWFWTWASRWPCIPSLSKQSSGLLHFPMSLGPSTDIVWPAGLLTRPPSLPGICC